MYIFEFKWQRYILGSQNSRVFKQLSILYLFTYIFLYIFICCGEEVYVSAHVTYTNVGLYATISAFITNVTS